MSSKFPKEKIFYLILTILIAIEIFVLSNISTTAGIGTKFNLATLYHFGVFFMFTFFLFLTLIDKKITRKLIFLVLLISLIYAASDEFHQFFVPGRFATIKDVAVDLVGSICAVLFLSSFKRFRKA